MFGGLIFLDRALRDSCLRMYWKAECSLGPSADRAIYGELKAVILSGRDKDKLFRFLNSVHKSAVVVKLDRICSEIFCDKKMKQRYLDYTFKQALKSALQQLLNSDEIPAGYSGTIDVRMSEHTTAMSGQYESRESSIQELKTGAFNWNYAPFLPPILPMLTDVRLEMRNSKLDSLIRTAGIVASRVYFKVRTNNLPDVRRKVSVLMSP